MELLSSPIVWLLEVILPLPDEAQEGIMGWLFVTALKGEGEKKQMNHVPGTASLLSVILMIAI